MLVDYFYYRFGEKEVNTFVKNANLKEVFTVYEQIKEKEDESNKKPATSKESGFNK